MVYIGGVFTHSVHDLMKTVKLEKLNQSVNFENEWRFIFVLLQFFQ